MTTFKPQLTGDLPPDWFAKESMTFLAPDGQANVIASSEPLDLSIDTDRYASVQGDLLRQEFPGFREIEFRQAQVLGDRQGYIRTFEWQPEDGVPVTQIQIYHARDGRGYTATVTTPSTEFPKREILLRQILMELRIEANLPS